jgi:hypothetical protein
MTSLSSQMKQKFFCEGHSVPKCINPGCERDSAAREWKNWSFKSECSRCMNARKNKQYILEEGIKYILDKKGNNLGIVIHKEYFCQNHDGHLGFNCPVPRDGWIGFESSLDLDHVDGDHYNNNPENVRTYCKLCHGRKSIESGDCNSNKSSARNIE